MFKIRKIKINLNTKDTGSFVSKSKHIIKLTGFFGAISYPGCVIVIEGEALIQLPSNTLINFSLKDGLSDDFSLYLVMCDMDYDSYTFKKMKPYIDSLIHVQNSIFEHTYRAFENHPHHEPGAKPTEHLIVNKLRDAKVLSQLKTQGIEGVVLLGEPKYYGRFGFESQPNLIFPGVPSEYFLAISLANNIPTGEVAYHSAFFDN